MMTSTTRMMLLRQFVLGFFLVGSFGGNFVGVSAHRRRELYQSNGSSSTSSPRPTTTTPRPTVPTKRPVATTRPPSNPTRKPTGAPTKSPPSESPSDSPSESASESPTESPTKNPTLAPVDSCQKCDDGVAATGRPLNFDTREEIFDQLSTSEYKSVIDYFLDEGYASCHVKKLVTQWSAQNENHIVFVQLFPPPKAEAIAYLDRETATPPQRYAIVTVNRAAQSPRDMMQYKVGPLANGELDTSSSSVISGGITVEELLKPNEIPWSQRGGYTWKDGYLDAIEYQAYKLRDIFLEVTRGDCLGPIGYLYRDCSPSTSTIKPVVYSNMDTNQTIRIHSVFFQYVKESFLPIPIHFQIVEDPDADPENWEARNFEYCYQGPYETAEALAEAHRNGELTSCPISDKSDAWMDLDPIQPYRQDAGIKEPSSFHSEGKRYIIDSAIDGTGHRVYWLGWSFHVSSDQMHGLIIRNLSFKGERLAYELSFQEYFASYSARGSPEQVTYWDSNWQIGKYSHLKRGVDCPSDATMLPMIQHDGKKASVKNQTLCIFETPTGESMWRHGRSYAKGIPRTLLQVRVVSTMGNYDYIPTMTLMADGVMKMGLEMGGILQTGYSYNSHENPEQPWFGTRVRDNTAGMLHDHIIGIKADLDVGGLENTLKAGKIKYGTFEDATTEYNAPAWHTLNGVKYMDWETIDSERGISHSDYDAITIESPTRNQWGAHRSYEIHFENSISRQLFPEDHPLAAATAWQYSNIAITRQNDTERYCSFPTNYQVNQAIPSFDLREFQKLNETVVEEDLVFWIMMGVQHYPKAEDIPLVSNFGTGFILKPRNMYDRAAFEDLPDNNRNDHEECIPSFV